MPIYKLERTEIVQTSLENCWQFFSDPRNLAKITAPSLKLQVQSALPEQIYPGQLIEYIVRPLLGIPVRWLTEIVQVDSPRYFADEQRVGPYRMWHHEHFFREIGDAVTECRDLVHYIPPFGPMGALLDALFIKGQLAKIFDFRAQVLTQLLERPGHSLT
jgi:ligand-binding SRPBCC domain-containing protein